MALLATSHHWEWDLSELHEGGQALLEPELAISASTTAHGEKRPSPRGKASCLQAEMNHPAQTEEELTAVIFDLKAGQPEWPEQCDPACQA